MCAGRPERERDRERRERQRERQRERHREREIEIERERERERGREREREKRERERERERERDRENLTFLLPPGLVTLLTLFTSRQNPPSTFPDCKDGATPTDLTPTFPCIPSPRCVFNAAHTGANGNNGRAAPGPPFDPQSL